jgi:uncharacterized protein YndB with AHSA1/START domain/predicted transcriptional regulator YdeE
MSAQPKARPSLTLVRRFKAPVEKVYAAWTDPAKIKAWFGPAPSDVTYLAEADVREGGRFRVAFRTAEGEDNDVSGIYREIAPDERLVFSWAWRTTPERESQVTLLFKAVGAETELTVLHENFFDQTGRDNHAKGWPGALDKLGAYLDGATPARFEDTAQRAFIGLAERFTLETRDNIPLLWRRFGPHIGVVPGQRGRAAYGIATAMTPEPFSFDYWACVEIEPSAATSAELARLDLPEQRYAVFASTAHIAQIRKVMDAVWRDWLPRSGRAHAAGAATIERYGEAFDPATGEGGFEIWLPLQS